ncbi:hypothetical protein KKG85_01875 [Patescibacteria group bacterium]|nr:hypothetical protein [Patescibacteria group bacterium]MBU2579875.1 hypothetical protein [Patescibacteria group bacterium]
MINEQKLKKLYADGLSMQEISEKMDWGYKKVVYWMSKYGILRRTRSEATYVKKNPNGDPFKIKQKLSLREKELKSMGLGLYWGEGDKSDYSSVRLGNTDSRLIKKFIEFLIQICGVKKEKLKYELQIFNDADQQKAIKFWMKELGIRKDDFTQIINHPPRGDGTYRNKNQTGVLIVYCHNKKLKKEIIKMLEQVL